MRFCWHDWSKWSLDKKKLFDWQYSKEMIYIQKRTCKKCNYMQTKSKKESGN